MDIEQKMSLIQQIHREQEANERDIYNNLRRRNYKWSEHDFMEINILGTWFSSFRIRFFIAILLFLCFFVMDKKEIVYGEINSSKVIEHIENNMTMKDFRIYFAEETK